MSTPSSRRIDTTSHDRRSDGKASVRSSFSSQSGIATRREDPDKKYAQFVSEIKAKVATSQLRSVLCKKNQNMLQKSVQRFKSEAGSSNDQYLARRAEQELIYLKLRDELYDAMNSRNLDKLLAVCDKLEKEQNKRFKNPLTADMMHARKLITMLNRTVELPETLDFDDRTMRELAQFSSPPKTVHDIVKAALLLLDEYEGHSRDWTFCRDMLRPYKSTGKGGLRWRIENFEPANVNEEIAGRVKQILDPYKIIDVFRVSEAAASLYVWTKSKLESVKIGAPADIKRQREILGVDLPPEIWRPKSFF